MTINLMNSYYPKSCSSFLRRRGYKSPCWAWKHPRSTDTYYPTKITKTCYMKNSQIRELDVTACKISFITKASKSTERSVGDPIKEKGTVAGAVALIIGTSIGSGILALPKKTSPAGFIPSATSMIFCWGFLLIEALLLAEINVGLRNDKKKRGEEDATLEIISIRTMAQETLGHWGGTLVTVNYIFLACASMVAYTSKSGEILSHVINLPTSVCGNFFTALFTLLISVGGTHLTDRINQWLTASMIGLLVMIEVIAAFSGGWSGLSSTANWNKVPVTIPVIIFSLVYHDLAPVLCTYLGGDIRRIRLSVVVGSIVPLVALLVWDAVALGLSQHADGIDPVELLMRVEWRGVSTMVEGFSLLAVGTSLIGTILGFSQFFEEQLNKLSFHSSTAQSQEVMSDGTKRRLFGLGKWWESNKINFAATAMVIAPPILVSTTVPDAFSAATDIAVSEREPTLLTPTLNEQCSIDTFGIGYSLLLSLHVAKGGYCMTILYGVLPPAMAWAMKFAKSRDENCSEDDQNVLLSTTKPVLLGVGLFACAIVMEQMLQDLSVIHL